MACAAGHRGRLQQSAGLGRAGGSCGGQSGLGGLRLSPARISRARLARRTAADCGRPGVVARAEGGGARTRRLCSCSRALFGQWGWQNETLELLWALSKTHQTRLEALQLLYQHYARTGDTGGVYRVLLRSAEIAPDDLTMQNNLAQVSLLLDADPERARKIAADLAQERAGERRLRLHLCLFALCARRDRGGAYKRWKR